MMRSSLAIALRFLLVLRPPVSRITLRGFFLEGSSLLKAVAVTGAALTAATGVTGTADTADTEVAEALADMLDGWWWLWGGGGVFGKLEMEEIATKKK